MQLVDAELALEARELQRALEAADALGARLQRVRRRRELQTHTYLGLARRLERRAQRRALGEADLEPRRLPHERLLALGELGRMHAEAAAVRPRSLVRVGGVHLGGCELARERLVVDGALAVEGLELRRRLRALLLGLQRGDGLGVGGARDEVRDGLSGELRLRSEPLEQRRAAALEGGERRKGRRQRLLRADDLRGQVGVQLGGGRGGVACHGRGAELGLEVRHEPGEGVAQAVDGRVQLGHARLPARALVGIGRVRVEQRKVGVARGEQRPRGGGGVARARVEPQQLLGHVAVLEAHLVEGVTVGGLGGARLGGAGLGLEQRVVRRAQLAFARLERREGSAALHLQLLGRLGEGLQLLREQVVARLRCLGARVLLGEGGVVVAHEQRALGLVCCLLLEDGGLELGDVAAQLADRALRLRLQPRRRRLRVREQRRHLPGVATGSRRGRGRREGVGEGGGEERASETSSGEGGGRA